MSGDEQGDPRNEQGEAPTSGGDDTTIRLREKADASRGGAIRERVKQKIEESEESEEIPPL